MAGCAHGWDKTQQQTSLAHFIEAKEQNYRFSVEMLNEK
jgi:hypothetical protein